MSITLSDQLRILFDWGDTPQLLSSIAEATGLSQQALANLLSGKVVNPRLNTLLALCQYYGISLDYFDCPTVEDCQVYLYHHHLRAGSPILHAIEIATRRLSSTGQHNVLAILEWRRLATKA